MYKSLLRPILFSLPPEEAHEFTLSVAKSARFGVVRSLVQALMSSTRNDSPLTCFGMTFPNPIWMASGVDKNATAVDFFSALGFGSIELGGVVPKAQSGNDKPRLHRFPNDGALINRMGFPSVGCDEVAKNLEAARRRLSGKETVRIGMNLAKATNTAVENAAEDYVESFRTLYDLVDFFTVNISCPNVAAYQVLQEKKNLTKILAALQQNNPQNKPLVLKLSSDLTEAATDEAIETGIEHGVCGIIATNTSTRRDIFPAGEALAGGLSGSPLFPVALQRVGYISQKYSGKLDIVGVGGIRSEQDVQQMLRAGAKAVQIYTALVYEGPGLIKKLKAAALDAGPDQ